VTIPSKADIDKRKKALEKFKAGLDSDGRASEKSLCTAIRSAVRLTWMRHNTKLAYLYEHTYPDMNPNTRTKWLCDCEMCGKAFKLADIEVNHRSGENSLLSFEDMVPFAKSILGVGFDDIEVLCKDCHSLLTYSSRYGVTLEEAKERKIVIQKLKQTVAKQKKELLAFGFKQSEISNETLRQQCYEKLLKENKIE
jgi:hypothetical protein